jgi:hypothetical protein
MENIFNKIMAEIFPNLGKRMGFPVKEMFRMLNRQYQKRTSPHHMIVKTLSMTNKEIILIATKKK